jgi:hypothetical protein
VAAHRHLGHHQRRRLVPPHRDPAAGFVTTGEDDYQDPQNFPILYLKDSAATFATPAPTTFSTIAPSKPGEAQSADFTLPARTPRGTYSLFVSACGVSSATGFSFTF